MDAPFELTLYSEDRRIVIGGVPAMAVPVPGQTLLIHDLGGSSV